MTDYCTVQDVAEFLTQLGFVNPAKSIVNIILTGTDPVIITTGTAHGFVTSEVVEIHEVFGTVGLNGNNYTITVLSTTQFSLDGTDSSTFAAYANGGIVYEYGAQEEGTWPDETLIQNHINMAKGEIDMALAAFGQGDCDLSEAATGFLKLLNVIGTVLITEFDNVRFLTEGDLARYQQWKDGMINRLISGEITVCDGETGINYPAFATAERAYTPEGAVKILQNYWKRSR